MKTYNYTVISNLGIRKGTIEARHKLKAQMRVHEKMNNLGYKEFKIEVK